MWLFPVSVKKFKEKPLGERRSTLYVCSRRVLAHEQGNFRYNPTQARRDGRVAEGGGLLNRCRALKLYRGFESPSLRQILQFMAIEAAQFL
jgi:hypothetical protein